MRVASDRRRRPYEFAGAVKQTRPPARCSRDGAPAPGDPPPRTRKELVEHSPTVLPVLKRWWWTLALAGVLAAATAYAVASWSAPTYRGEVKLLVGPISAGATDLDAAGELGRTYSELAPSRPILRDAIKAADVDTTPDELRKRLSATANQVSRIVTITVDSGSPDEAAALANAIGERLEELSKEGPAQESEVIGKFLDQGALSGLPESDRDEIESAARRSFGESLAGQVQVVDPAEKPEAPVGPMVPLLTLLAGLGGVLAAGVFALVRGASAIDDDAELADFGGARFLGSIEASRSRNVERALPVWRDPERPAADAYRLLAAKIGFLGAQPPLRSLTVLDTGDGRTGGVVAANLARVLAETGWSVLLADANTSAPGVTSLLELDDRPGYADLLARDLSALNGEVDELLTSPATDLDVLPVGTGGPPAQFGAESAEYMLARLRATCDIVVVSAPPVNRSPAALVWAGVTDGTLLAVEEGRTSREELDDAISSLTLVEAKLVGTLLARGPQRLGVFEGLGETAKSLFAPGLGRPRGAYDDDGGEPWLPRLDLTSAAKSQRPPAGRAQRDGAGGSRQPPAGQRDRTGAPESRRPRGGRRV
jgi:Mrp family chromosome partitioning ATPase